MKLATQRAIAPVQACPICNGRMETVIGFPRMPICGRYETHASPFRDHGYADQSLLYCEGCSHAKLGTVVTGLYGGGYAATSSSAGSSAGVANFSRFVCMKLRLEDFELIVDIGGNDGSLGKFFPGKRFVTIDPNASGDGEIIKDFIENVDLGFLKDKTKLFCCSHTLEHIEHPEAMFGKLTEVVKDGDYLAFQFPSLELLVRDCRIDQIYHEHLHYYSLRSASLLFARHGFNIVAHQFDADHYGALMVIARKMLPEAKGEVIEGVTIDRARGLFDMAMDALDSRIMGESELIGFGASQMLPLLKYHLRSLGALKCVMDDDKAKHGLRYANFNVPIVPVSNVSDKTVMVTAFNTKMAVRRIVQKLLSTNARDVIVPFNYL